MPAPKRYFHASPHPFTSGDVLTPGSDRGVSTFKHGEVTNTRVFLTDNPTDAETWARIIGPCYWETVYIYEVRPAARVYRRDTDALTTSSAVVLRAVATLEEPAEFNRSVVQWDHEIVWHPAT